MKSAHPLCGLPISAVQKQPTARDWKTAEHIKFRFHRLFVRFQPRLKPVSRKTGYSVIGFWVRSVSYETSYATLKYWFI